MRFGSLWSKHSSTNSVVNFVYKHDTKMVHSLWSIVKINSFDELWPLSSQTHPDTWSGVDNYLQVPTSEAWPTASSARGEPLVKLPMLCMNPRDSISISAMSSTTYQGVLHSGCPDIDTNREYCTMIIGWEKTTFISQWRKQPVTSNSICAKSRKIPKQRKLHPFTRTVLWTRLSPGTKRVPIVFDSIHSVNWLHCYCNWPVEMHYSSITHPSIH